MSEEKRVKRREHKITILVTKIDETHYSFDFWGRTHYVTPEVNPDIFYQIKEQEKLNETNIPKS
jgi:hypothetical protein